MQAVLSRREEAVEHMNAATFAGARRELCIVGAGYVGLPLAQVFAEAGVPTVLVDIDERKVDSVNRGESYIEDVPSEALASHVGNGLITATTSYDVASEADAIIIALPT